MEVRLEVLEAAHQVVFNIPRMEYAALVASAYSEEPSEAASVEIKLVAKSSP